MLRLNLSWAAKMIWLLLLIPLRMGVAWMLHTPGGGLLEDRCPCLPPALCPRIFGQSPVDVRHFGQLPVCWDTNRVRCCGASVTIQRLTPLSYKQDGDYKLLTKKIYRNDNHIKRSINLIQNSNIRASNESGVITSSAKDIVQQSFNSPNPSAETHITKQKSVELTTEITIFAKKMVNSSRKIFNSSANTTNATSPMPNSTTPSKELQNSGNSLTTPVGNESVVLVYSTPFVQTKSRKLDIDDSHLMIVFSATEKSVNLTQREEKGSKRGLNREEVVERLNGKKEYNTTQIDKITKKPEDTDKYQAMVIPSHPRKTKINTHESHEIIGPKSVTHGKIDDSVLVQQSMNGLNKRPVPTLNNTKRLRDLFARRKPSRLFVREPEESASTIEEVNIEGPSPNRNYMEFGGVNTKSFHEKTNVRTVFGSIYKHNQMKTSNLKGESSNEQPLEFGQRIVPRLVGAGSELRPTVAMRPIVVLPIKIKSNQGNFSNIKHRMEFIAPLMGSMIPPRIIRPVSQHESTNKQSANKERIATDKDQASMLLNSMTKYRPRLRSNTMKERPVSLESIMEMMNKEVVKEAFEKTRIEMGTSTVEALINKRKFAGHMSLRNKQSTIVNSDQPAENTEIKSMNPNGEKNVDVMSEPMTGKAEPSVNYPNGQSNVKRNMLFRIGEVNITTEDKNTFKNVSSVKRERKGYNRFRLNGHAQLRGLGNRSRQPIARNNNETQINRTAMQPVDSPAKTKMHKMNSSSEITVTHFKTPSSRVRASLRTMTSAPEEHVKIGESNHTIDCHRNRSIVSEKLKLAPQQPVIQHTLNITATTNVSTQNKLNDLELSETTSIEQGSLFKPPESMERGFQPMERPELHVVGPIPLGFRGFDGTTAGSLTKVRFAKTLDGIPEVQLQLPQQNPTDFDTLSVSHHSESQPTHLELPTENNPHDFVEVPSQLQGNQPVIAHTLHSMQSQYDAAVQQYNLALEFYNKHYKIYIEKYKENIS